MRIFPKYIAITITISIIISSVLLFVIHNTEQAQYNYYILDNIAIYFIIFQAIFCSSFLIIYGTLVKHNSYYYILIVLNTSFVMFYIFYTYKQYYYTDAVGYLLYAREMLASGEFFPDTYIYGDGIPIIDLNLYALLFLNFIKDLYLVHNLTMYTNFIIILISFYILFIVLGIKHKTMIVFYAVFTTGITGFISKHLFGEGGYGLNLIMIILTISFTLWLKKNGPHYSKKKIFILLLVYFLWVLQTRVGFGLLSSKVLLLPLFLSLIITFVIDYKYFNPNNKMISIIMLIIIIASFTVAPSVRNLLQGEQSYSYLEPSFNEIYDVNIDHILAKYSVLMMAIKKLNDDFIYLNEGNIYKALYYYKTLILIVVWIVPFILLYFSIKIHDSNLLFLSAFSILYSAVILGGLIITHVAYNEEAARYLIMPTIISLTLSLLYLDKIININVIHSLVFVMFIPFIISSYLYLIIPYGNVNNNGSFTRTKNNLEEFTNKLIDNDIRYAYSTYWYSGVPTILSNERISIRAISITSDGLVVPDLLGSSKQWYSSAYYQGKTCLILLPHEYNKINSTTLNLYLGPPDLQHIINNFVIICYNFNIASKLPNWN